MLKSSLHLKLCHHHHVEENQQTKWKKTNKPIENEDQSSRAFMLIWIWRSIWSIADVKIDQTTRPSCIFGFTGFPKHFCFTVAQSDLRLSALLAHLSLGELIGYPWSGIRRHCPSSVRCLSTISNVFSSDTAWPIRAKFYMEPPWKGGTNVYINGPGHITKMAAMSIYGKNLKKSSSPEPDVLWSWNLACSIGDSSSTKFI